jgi:XTP/dITP diphosphohydrolase
MAARLVFITSNPAKVKMGAERLEKYGISVSQASLELEEVQSFDVAEVAEKKIRQAMSKLTEPFFVEDSGFYIKALKGFPGPMIKSIMIALGDERVTKLVGPNDPREVEVVSVIAYGDPATGTVKTFQGLYLGTIAESPRGTEGRGWLLSKIFIPHGWTKTLAELDEAEWQRFLDDFRHNDHFDKLGQWLSEQKQKK